MDHRSAPFITGFGAVLREADPGKQAWRVPDAGVRFALSR